MDIIRMFQNRKLVLGLNDRALNYIRKYNKNRSIRVADNKLLTKKVLEKKNIPTPKLINVINNYQELEDFNWDNLPKSFVIKPVAGLEGSGIDIFYNRDKDGKWIRANKTRASISDIKQQVRDILDGRYSLNQKPDKVLFEARIRSHKAFKYYTYKGAPDIRVIVFNNIPIMAFLRLPTKESEGKANLALGAIALGIDMATGVTTSGIHGKAGEIEYIPGTKIHVSGLKIPFWTKILTYSIQAQIASKLNFAAVDFLIDEDIGPVIVEMNARVGLSIQLANGDGLRWRLKKARGVKVTSIEKGVRLARDLFGGEIEEEIETISGKEVIGLFEKVRIYNDQMQEYMSLAKIDTGADSTSIDLSVAQNLGFEDLINDIDNEKIPDSLDVVAGMQLAREIESRLKPKHAVLIGINYIKSSHGTSLRPNVRITMKIKDNIFETNATIFDRRLLTYPIIVGRKSLTRFLIDPSKNKTADKKVSRKSQVIY